jgi:hypothetical protein
MTAIDVTFRYAGRLEAEQMQALSDAFGIYGVRRIQVDEAQNTITVEYDATRLSNDIVAAILRRCRVDVRERVDKTLPAEPAPAAQKPA